MEDNYITSAQNRSEFEQQVINKITEGLYELQNIPSDYEAAVDVAQQLYGEEISAALCLKFKKEGLPAEVQSIGAYFFNITNSGHSPQIQQLIISSFTKACDDLLATREEEIDKIVEALHIANFIPLEAQNAIGKMLEQEDNLQEIRKKLSNKVKAEGLPKWYTDFNPYSKTNYNNQKITQLIDSIIVLHDNLGCDIDNYTPVLPSIEELLDGSIIMELTGVGED